MRARRTYAVTGDRIALDLLVNGRVMGQELPYAREREIRVEVTGWDQVDRVEVLKNNRVIHRDFPMDRQVSARGWERPVLIRFEYGWGPWPALGIGGTADWDIRVRIQGGTLEDVQPCFQAGPLEEGRRDRILERTPAGCACKRLPRYASRSTTLAKGRGPQSARRAGDAGDVRFVGAQAGLPYPVSEQLAESGEALFTGEFPRESALVHRLVHEDHYRTSFTVRDTDDGRQASWYYVRVIQANGQLAWSSPIWVEKA